MAKATAKEATEKPLSASEVLSSISLDQIDSELAELESQKDELQKQIDGLKACRKVIDVRLNGKQKRGWSDEQRQKAAATKAAKKAAKFSGTAPAAGSGAMGTNPELVLVEKIARYLLKVDAAKPFSICQSVGVASPEILRLLKKYNDRFVCDPTDDKWSVRAGD